MRKQKPISKGDENVNCEEAIELLKEHLLIGREQVSVDRGVVYYKITFVFRGHLCTVLRPHDDIEPLFSIGTHYYGTNTDYFLNVCLSLEVPE